METYVKRRFLEKATIQRGRVEIVTRNGYHMYGTITDYDRECLLVNVAGVDRLVMLDAVSTIVPKEPLAQEVRGVE